MCPKMEWFLEYDEVSNDKIKMTNGFACKIIGIGSIKLKTYDDRLCILTKAGHAPSISKNLILVSLLDSIGFKYSGGDGRIPTWVQMCFERFYSWYYVFSGR